MEENMSITVKGNEITFSEDMFIVSKTDTKGNITYGNETFIEISGYSEDELIGAPHNILRHRDMPKVVFKLLWDKIQKGEEAFGTTKGYAQFDIPHQKLHNSVISSVNYLRSTTTNLLAEKDDLIANFIQMEDESKEVFSSLSSMLEESLANK